MLRSALLNIYSKEFHPASEIEVSLFNEIWAQINNAAKEGFGQSRVVDPDEDFRNEILRNNAVFSAFKVHRMQNDMAQLLLDSKGNLKPFEQWRKEVLPIASHQVGTWLRTEYDTAVIRAHQAADWRQFEREKDILPNLRWVESTSIHPGLDHKRFWGTIRSIDDAFWSEHRPGDRWNCKCSLSSTDEPETPVPESSPLDKPQKGLENNPGKDAKLFSDQHPYQSETRKGAKKAVDKLMARIDEMIAEMSDNLTYEEKMAIARNNLEIEKVLNVTKGKPMSVEEADRQNANPRYGETRGFGINCQTCSPAYALRSRGFDVTALSNTPGSKLDYLSRGINTWEVWENTDGSQAKPVSAIEWLAQKGYKQMNANRYLQFFQETCREEGIYEVVIYWKGGGGHATILQRFADGELRRIEPQHDNQAGSGREWDDLEFLCRHGRTNPFPASGVMRIDNKLFNVAFLDIFGK